MIVQILIPVAAMAALGLLFGAGLAYALRIFRIEVDPQIFLILSKLPGSNCGACGKAGCAGFAEALARGEAIPSACVLSNEEARKSIAEALGIEYNARVKTVATLLCNGGKNAGDKYVYHGIRSCKAASLLFDGYKACAFGCLGLGDCVDACPFGALKIGADDLPVVDPARCTACGKCVRACPKNLFELAPIDKKYYVKCSSRDPGNVVMKICKNGCIACRKCENSCPSGAIRVESNLARIDYGKCKNIGKCFEVCPTKVIARREK